jgi:hypothetical protein
MQPSDITGPMRGVAERREIAAVCLASAVLGLLVIAGLSDGYFLSDDLGHLPSFQKWSADGTLASAVIGRFASGIDGVNAYYRPLAFLSLAVDFRLHGATATGWLVVNLALHVGSAALAGWLAWQLAGDGSRAALAAALLAGLLFVALSPGWEAALWIACRYDALATFFVLLAGALFARSRRALDRWALASLAASVAALMSKESGSAANVLVGCLAAARAWPGERHGARPLSRWLALAWPWLALLVLYALLRQGLFGSAFRVQLGTGWPDLAAPEHWRNVFESAGVWSRKIFPGFPGLAVAAALGAASVALGAWLAWERSAATGMRHAAAVAALAGSAVLLLPHIHGLEATGIGGRLFHQMSALYCVVVALGVHAALLAPAGRMPVRLAMLGSAALLLAIHVPWGWQAVDSYAHAHRAMRSLAPALEALAAQRGGDEFAVVIVPDSVGRVPFGRNGQAGLMLPPVQPRPLSRSLLVQTDAELDGLEAKIAGGVIDALREHSLFDVIEGATATRRGGSPPLFFCWNARSARLRPLDPGGGPLLDGNLSARLARGLEAAGCR